jgi:hypothetical protein
MSYGAVATIIGTGVLAATFTGTTAVQAEQALDRTKVTTTTILPFAAELAKIAVPPTDSVGLNWSCNGQWTHPAGTGDTDCSISTD